MPAPFGPDDADPVAAPRRQEGRPWPRRLSRQVADDEVLDPDDDLARPNRPGADEALRPAAAACASASARPAAPRAAARAEPRARASSRSCGGSGSVWTSSRSRAICCSCVSADFDRERVALLALPVVRAVVAAERRELPIAQLPDPVDRSRRGTRGRARRRAASPRGGGGGPPATRARRGRGGSSARRGRAGPARRSRVAPAWPASARRPTATTAAGPCPRPLNPSPPTAPRRPAGRACSRRASRTDAGGPRTPARSARWACSSASSSTAIASSVRARRGGPPSGRPARP